MQIQTYSGQLYDLRYPDVSTVGLDDIAHALGNICRFTGATRGFYSVAQHSVVCSFLVAPEHALHALLHDAPEAYVGDRSSPVGWVHQWARNFRAGGDHTWADPHAQMHHRAEIAIYHVLGVALPDAAARAAVKAADYAALRHETTVHLRGGPAPDPDTGQPWCEPLAIDPSTLVHPWEKGTFQRVNGQLAQSLLYGNLPPIAARGHFLSRLIELAEGPWGNPELAGLAQAEYDRPPLEALSYRKIRQQFGHLAGQDPDDYPGYTR